MISANLVLKFHMRQTFDTLDNLGCFVSSKPAAPQTAYEKALENQNAKKAEAVE